MNERNNSTPSVMLFLPDLFGGGAERAVINLLKSWMEVDYLVKPILVLRRKAGPYLSDLPIEIEVIELGTERSGLKASLITVLKLAILLRRKRPIAVVSFLSHPSIVFARILSGVSSKIFASIQNPVVIGGSDLTRGIFRNVVWKIKRGIVAFSFRRTDLFFPISAGIGKELQNVFGVRSSVVKLVPNSVEIPTDLNEIQVPAVISMIREQGFFVLVTAGRLVRQKAYDVLIKAMVNVKNHGVKAKLVILGDGELRDSLRAEVEKCGLEADVFFVGFQSQPSSFFVHADLFVLASRYEGFGNVIIEAMSCGCPVVCTDAPYGPSDILMDSEFGLLVPTERPDLLAAGIERMLADENMRTCYASSGSARANAYRRETVFMQFMKHLEEGAGVKILRSNEIG